MKLQNGVGRSCGSCNACCKVFLVPEVGKTDGNWCQHCVIGTGCAIYNGRPYACMEFACAWLNGLGDDNLRPDLFGVMIDVQDLELDNGRVVGFIHFYEMKKGGLDAPYVRQMIEANKNEGFVVSATMKVAILTNEELVCDAGSLLRVKLQKSISI